MSTTQSTNDRNDAALPSITSVSNEHQDWADALTTGGWSNMAADCRSDPTAFPSNGQKYTAVQKTVKITGKNVINSDAKVKSAPDVLLHLLEGYILTRVRKISTSICQLRE